jgi:hypothetical protein
MQVPQHGRIFTWRDRRVRSAVMAASCRHVSMMLCRKDGQLWVPGSLDNVMQCGRSYALRILPHIQHFAASEGLGMYMWI